MCNSVKSMRKRLALLAHFVPHIKNIDNHWFEMNWFHTIIEHFVTYSKMRNKMKWGFIPLKKSIVSYETPKQTWLLSGISLVDTIYLILDRFTQVHTYIHTLINKYVNTFPKKYKIHFWHHLIRTLAYLKPFPDSQKLIDANWITSEITERETGKSQFA